MRKGQLLLLAFIGIFGALIAYFTYDYLKGSKTKIYLFANDYEAGTVITQDMLVTLEVDATMVDNLAYSNAEAKYVTPNDLKQIVSAGDTLGADVFYGTPFMTTQTSTIGGSAVERRLGDYMTAITIPVNNISGVSPEISAGAKINIYSCYETENYEIEELLFQNVKILEVQATGDSSSGYNLSAITIELKPEDALKILHSINFRKIDITLLKSGKYNQLTDNSVYKVNPVIVEALLGGN